MDTRTIVCGIYEPNKHNTVFIHQTNTETVVRASALTLWDEPAFVRYFLTYHKPQQICDRRKAATIFIRLYGRFSGASRTKNTFDDACGTANSVEDCTHQEKVEPGIRNFSVRSAATEAWSWGDSSLPCIEPQAHPTARYR
jgi:hypothetical protein